MRVTDETIAQRFRAAALLIALTAAALVFIQTDAKVSDLWFIKQRYMAAITVVVFAFVVLRFVLDLVVELIRTRRSAAHKGQSITLIVFRRIRWTDMAAALLALAILSSSGTVYKTTQIGSDGYGWDAMFIAWDRALFFGYDPWQLTHAIFSTPRATAWIDFFYHGLFLPMILGYILCVALVERPELRYTYILSFLGGILVTGMIMAAWLHSAGPVYDGHLFGDGRTFGPLIDRLAAQAEEERSMAALRAQDYLLRMHETGRIGFAGGISAMPSVHLMLTFIWMFAAWHIHKALGVLCGVYTAIIWIGSVHLGWHYFVDGLVSLVVMIVIWRLAGRLCGLYPSAQVIRATT